MADVRLQVAAPLAVQATNRARLICGSLSVSLRWWPDEISWSALANSWTELQRPGNWPLLVNDARALPEISIGFIASNKDTSYIGDGGSILPMLDSIDEMTNSSKPVQLMLGTRDAGRFRIIDFNFTELDHNTDGQPVRAEISLVIKQAQDAAAPIGPVKASKRKGK